MSTTDAQPFTPAEIAAFRSLVAHHVGDPRADEDRRWLATYDALIQRIESSRLLLNTALGFLAGTHK